MDLLDGHVAASGGRGRTWCAAGRRARPARARRPARRRAGACMPSASSVRSSGCRRRGREVLGAATRGSRPARRRAGRPRPAKSPPDLVGVQVGLGEQVADAGEREVPAVARRAQELLEHREVHVVARRRRRRRRRLEPAVERGDVVGAGAGQHLVDGDVGVGAGRDLAEHLHQRVLAEGDRGVGLLAAEQGRVGRRGRGRGPAAGGTSQRAVGRGASNDRSQQAIALAVVHRVVDVAGAEVVVGPDADQACSRWSCGARGRRPAAAGSCSVSPSVVRRRGRPGRSPPAGRRRRCRAIAQPADRGRAGTAGPCRRTSGRCSRNGASGLAGRRSSRRHAGLPVLGGCRSAGTSRSRTHPGSADTAARRSRGNGTPPSSSTGTSPPSGAGRARPAAGSGTGC